MDYSYLDIDDIVELTVDPVLYAVSSKSHQQITLTSINESLTKLHLIKNNGQWELDGTHDLEFQFKTLTPHLHEQPNVAEDILLKLDIDDLGNVCQTDRHFLSVCKDSDFWHKRWRTKYGDSTNGLFKEVESIGGYIQAEREISAAAEFVDNYHHQDAETFHNFINNLIDNFYNEEDFDNWDILMYTGRELKRLYGDVSIYNYLYDTTLYLIGALLNGKEYYHYLDEVLSVYHPNNQEIFDFLTGIWGDPIDLDLVNLYLNRVNIPQSVIDEFFDYGYPEFTEAKGEILLDHGYKPS